MKKIIAYSRFIGARIVLMGLVMSFVGALAQGCVALGKGTATRAITEADARSIHPMGKEYRLRQHVLTAYESQRINDRLGRPGMQEGEVVAYYEVTHTPKQMIGETGTVFVAPIEGPHGPMKLIVSVRGRVAQRLLLKDGSAVQSVGHEFLDQFIGRDLEHSFRVESEPEAFHRLPAPVAPWDGQVDLSQRIADAVFKVLVVATALEVR